MASRSGYAAAAGVALAVAAIAVGAVSQGGGAASSAAVGATVRAGAYGHLLFVAGKDTSVVAAVDTGADRVVARFDVGLAPDQLVVSDAAGVVVAADGAARRLAIYDPVAGALVGVIDLDLAPERLLLSPDGFVLAVADLSAGRVDFVSLHKAAVMGSATGLGHLSDMTFEPDGAFLYVSRSDRLDVAVIDVAGAGVVADFPVVAGPRQTSGVASLARTPTGRLGFARLAGSGALAAFDLLDFAPTAVVRGVAGDGRVYPTSYGRYLVAADEKERSVALVSTTSLTVVAHLAGTREAGGVSTGFFETVAFVSDRVGRSARIVDLTALADGGAIALPGTPGQGAVISDGSKLYLPLDEGGLAVIDTRRRTVATVISGLPSAPMAVALARSFDICH